jgi:hypothetical protein
MTVRPDLVRMRITNFNNSTAIQPVMTIDCSVPCPLLYKSRIASNVEENRHMAEFVLNLWFKNNEIQVLVFFEKKVIAESKMIFSY